MQLKYFTENLNNPGTLVPAILKEYQTCFRLDAFKQYNPIFHKVNSKVQRPDKTIYVPDPSGEMDDKGEVKTQMKTEPVNRIPLPMQKLIVSRATAFATGGKITLKGKPADDAQKTMFQKIQDVWRQNKVDFMNPEIVRSIYSETECAEIWYTKPLEDGTKQLRCRTYKPSDGFQLIPVFDEFRDLIAFGLGYESKSGSNTIKHLDVYTKTELRRHININTGWTLAVQKEGGPANPLKREYGKIPVIYYSAPQSIWQDVQPIIERLEELMSNFADTVDYNGSPMIAATGQILGWSAKGERGKVVELTQGADLKYLSWDQAPDAIKLEIETLVDFIYTMTQTPNISFKEMKDIGDISGVAYDRIMIDAHLKAKDIQNGIYGEGVQRRLNFMVSASAAIYPETKAGYKLEITPEFGIFKIDDEAERIENASTALNAKLVDHVTAIRMAGLTDDPEATKELIDAEKPEPVNPPTPPT